MKNNFRKIIYIFLGLFFSLFLKNYPKVVVFCYHGFSNDSWRFNVKRENFVKQINIISKYYDFISTKDLENYLNKKNIFSKPVALITIDDGYKDILGIKDFLMSKHIQPLVFLLEDSKHLNHEELDNKKKILSDKDIKQLINLGWDFGSHSATHSDFNILNKSKLDREIKISKLNLEKRLRIKIKYFAFPKGRYSKEILEIVRRSGYKMSFTMNDDIIDSKTNLYTIPRVGVDGTHGLLEFKFIFTVSSIYFRKIVKKYLPQLAV